MGWQPEFKCIGKSNYCEWDPDADLLLLILFLNKIMIFGAKIQIIQANMPFKHSQKIIAL